MPKDEWGVKRLCPTCHARFYDLRRNPMTCPSCSAVFSLESLLGNRVQSTVAQRKAAVPPKATLVEDDIVLEVEEEDDVELEDDLLEDDEDENVDLDDIADVAADDET
ncbi:MAG: TIGR02300 family protein [Alphaproteobacteria bacterium HGW-Alphaproteobacteria-2]|nr:MAG: TIGR02300 family protein [Alphaproteobacteria bacterium HGW-Alphaproteobacteria-2]